MFVLTCTAQASPPHLYNVMGEIQTQTEAVERSGALDAQTHQVRTARRGTEACAEHSPQHSCDPHD